MIELMRYERFDRAVVLEIAADLIEAFGWLRGNYGDAAQGYCVEGAIHAAAKLCPPGKWVSGAGAAAFYAFARFTDTSRPAHYNDQVGRTREECLAALRACSAIERAKIAAGDLPRDAHDEKLEQVMFEQQMMWDPSLKHSVKSAQITLIPLLPQHYKDSVLAKAKARLTTVCELLKSQEKVMS